MFYVILLFSTACRRYHLSSLRGSFYDFVHGYLCLYILMLSRLVVLIDWRPESCHASHVGVLLFMRLFLPFVIFMSVKFAFSFFLYLSLSRSRTTNNTLLKFRNHLRICSSTTFHVSSYFLL